MKSFGFKNFRKFENFPMIDLGGINILVGTNNSGKSTAIKALMLTLLNAKREQTGFMRYESEKSMLPPFLYIFDFSFEVLEHLYLGDFKSALNYNDKTKEITISFEEGGTYFSFSFTSHIDERPSAYFTKSTVCNEHLGIKYDYVFDNSDLKHRGFLPSHGSVTCKFTIPIKDLERFKDSIEEQVAIYESLNSEKACRELVQFKKCLEDYKDGKDEFTLTYNFFRSHQYRSFSGGTPHCEFLKDFFSKKNNIIVKEFQSLPAVSYIETHNASHRLLLDKEDKNNYLAQTVSLYLRNCGEAQHKLESGFISKWMREFEVGAYLEIVDVYGEAYRVNVIDSDGHNVPLAHKGTGTIQLVTLLMRLASYDAEAGKRIVVIEEPEQNMHPKLQSKLADLLYEVWKESNGNLQFVVETHSEYLVRRLQGIAARLIFDGVKYTKEVNEDFKVYYFPEEGNPYSLNFRNEGHFDRKFGEGFFDEAGRSYHTLTKLERGIR